MIPNVLKAINKGINKLMRNQTKYTINGKDYVEDRLIAEGGFGYVYVVEDPENNKQYALKKMNIMESEQLLHVKREVDYWKKINNHTNIVRLIDYEISKSTALILMELCSDGTLLDQINNRAEKIISEKHALYIIKEIASGLSHMHNQNPPIAHRDIKIENILKIGNNYKLCDFGSTSVDTLDPRKEDKNTILENFSKFERMTTFIYRAPEMCDPYSKYPIDEKVDIWMLGCILYAVLFQKHPFQDAQKLTIINAHYYIPEEHVSYSEKIIDLMRLMLTPNPINRPTAKNVLNYIGNWDNIRSIDLPPETREIKEKQIRNFKTKNTKLLTNEDIQRVQAEILQDQKKKNRFKFKKEQDDDDIAEVFDDMDFVENKNEEFNKGKNADTFNNNRGRNFLDDSKNRNRSKSPIFNQGNTNFNQNYNKNFDGFKNSTDISKVKKDWMVEFTFNDNNNNYDKKNYAGFEDNGFDFDFVSSSNANKSINNLNKPVTTKEIKDEFEDFIFTSSSVPSNTAKSNSATYNNNLLDLGNKNANYQYNNNNRTNQITPNLGYNYNNQNNMNMNVNYVYNNMYGFDVNTGYSNQAYTHKTNSTNIVNNTNVNTVAFNAPSSSSNKTGNNLNSNFNKNPQTQANFSNNKSGNQNIYDFFK